MCMSEGDKSMWRTTVAASLMLVSATALADDKSDCLDSKDHNLRIKGCSAMIEHNPKDVVAYHNRGDAHGLKGEVDQAISDYTKAIVMNPNYAPAYNSRGRAYVSKGDYVRAVDDVTKAGELARKVWPSPAVVKAAPAKQKQASKPGLPVAGKPPDAEKPSAPGKAPVPEKSPAVGKASVAEKAPKESRQHPWPAWDNMRN